MKKLLLISLFGFLIFSFVLEAQEKDSAKTNATEYTPAEVYPLGVGVFVAAKGGINTLDSPDGVKNGFVFSSMPDFGAQVYIPFGGVSNLGAVIDFAYLTYAYKFKLYNNEDINWVDNVSYFSIAPNFHFSGFLLGFNFGIPLSASSGQDVDGNDYTYDYEKDNLALLIDIHLGAMVPLYKDNFGRLNFYIQGEYALSSIFTNNLTTIDKSTNPSFNIQPAAVKMGLSYMFNTGLMQK